MKIAISIAALAAALVASPVLAQQAPAMQQPTAAEAEAFLTKAEKALFDQSLISSRAAWINATYITDDTDALDEAAVCLDACVRHNPLPMGSPYEQSFRLTRVGLDGAVMETGAAAENGTQSAVSIRTSAFVKAISEDLKFHMDDSQALYKSSSATGAALKI